MEEDNLKNYISMYEELKRNKDIIDNIDKRFFFEFVDTLLKAYKELKEENKTEFARGYTKCRVDFYKNFIPIYVVEEKIEELKEEIEQLRIEKNVTYDSGIYRNRIKLEILQELLEKR